MAKIAGGRIFLNNENENRIDGWAILVHGKTRADLLFSSFDAAATRRLLDRAISHCEIVRVSVVGSVVTRLAAEHR